jgi:uncharacterized protein (DUF58 family)
VKLPDLEELLALRGAARKLGLHVQRHARGSLLGSHRSSHRGRGLEFEEVRPYIEGDDPRSIDWRVTARRGRVHTKLFREERERPVWLLVDLGCAMFFGSRLQLKSMVAVRAAALLAWSAALGGDRVGAVIGNSSSIRVLPPRSREAGVLPILNALVALQPRAPAAAAAEGLFPALRALAPLVHPGSYVWALSDFGATRDEEQSLWSRMAAHSECRWLWITDALEQHSLPNGRFRVGFPQPVVPIDGAAVRSQWLNAWRQRETRVRSGAEALRIGLLQLDTGREVSENLGVALQKSKSAA